MTKLLFIGDITGQVALDYLEVRLPALIADHQPDFIVANDENEAITSHPLSPGRCGMTPEGVARLFALGVDVITGGNHSWDGPYGRTIHDDPRILRPMNFGTHAPGRGSTIIEKAGVRLGVINLVSRTALTGADAPFEFFERQMQIWDNQVDAVLVDFHGESVTEKQTFAWAVDGQATAVLGTHTHVATLDTRILPHGTAYVTDVGMTGPSGGMQGYDPALFANMMRLRLPSDDPYQLASGPVELGAVLVEFEGRHTTRIERIQP
jgi:metallophosphoesterase (TIGR00282 family)